MRTRKAAMSFIFITLLIDVISFGIIIPVIGPLIAKLNNVPINEASKYGSILLAVFAIAQFFFAPIIGNLSDKYGRRPILLCSLLGFSLDYLILAFAPNFAWLLVGRFIAGITGASFSTATAYIADISTPENKAKNFGLIGVAFGVGFFLGPTIGGVLGKVNLHLPFYVTAVLCFLNFVFGYFVLPESLAVENRRAFDWKRCNPFVALKNLNQFKSLGWLLTAFFFLALGSHAVQSNWAYFNMYKFNWNEMDVGLSLALVGLLVGAVQGGLITLAIKKLGKEKCVYLGFTLYAIGMFLFGMASNSWMMYAFLIPYCLGGISGPAIQTIMSDKIPANQQGELQGGLTSMQSLSSILGPLMMNNLFAFFTSKIAPIQLPGISFFVGAFFMAISAVMTYRVLKNKATTP
jgi:MFS transporter, DHA1 family, tetracycline resistance protein